MWRCESQLWSLSTKRGHIYTFVVETQGLETLQKAAARDELNGVKLRFLQESQVPDARAAQHPQVVAEVS